jgi:hypothetical protein
MVNAQYKDIPNKLCNFGTVVSHGKNKCTWNVKFDILPSDDNIIQNISLSKLIGAGDGKEEKPIADGEMLDEMEITDSKDGDVSPQKKSKGPSSDDVFCSLDKANIRDTVYNEMGLE